MRSLATAFARPRLFISYAREDVIEARLPAHELERHRCIVFLDEEQLLIGEQFATKLQAALKDSDGLVFLHTASSQGSEWCRAEVYAAAALGLPVLRIKKREAPALPDPMERILAGVHYLEWRDFEPPPLTDHLVETRKRAQKRVMQRGAAFGGAAAVLVLVAALFLSRWDAWQTQQRRNGVERSIAASTVPWSAAQVEATVAGMQGDRDLLGRVRTMKDDPAIAGNLVHLNAWQVDQYLSQAQERTRRWDLSGVQWRKPLLQKARLVDATMRHGRIDDLVATDCMIAGTYFGPGPGQHRRDPGLSFIDARFTNCDFWNVWFDATQIIDAEFLDSKFRGVDLSLEALAAVRFRSSPADAIITGRLSLFENSTIRGRAVAPEAGVLDLSTPAHEVVFDGVEFVRVIFSGWLKPEWFRNSHFVDCVFPESLTEEALVRGGNRVERSAP